MAETNTEFIHKFRSAYGKERYKNCQFSIDILDACDRLEQLQASHDDLTKQRDDEYAFRLKIEKQRDDLLVVCGNLRGFLLTQHLTEVREKENYACPKSCATCYLLNEGLAAIAKAQSNTSVQPKKSGVTR